MIGMFCVATFPYYDTSTGRNKFKKRPMIILGQADSSDYVTLPVSKVSISFNPSKTDTPPYISAPVPSPFRSVH